MQMKKASLHIGRLNGKSSGRHNDRTFDTSKNESIQYPEDAVHNCYYVSDETGKFNLVEANRNEFEKREREFYKEHFSQSLKAKNERYKHEGHKERCKTITQLRKGAKTAPNEIILQVGKAENPYTDGDSFRKRVLMMVSRIRKECPQFKILNWAIHCDETSMHCHIRGVFVAKDRDGFEEPNQSKALREMGFEKPEPDKASSKNNNEMMTFTESLRTEWYDTVEMVDPDIKIDREVHNPGQRHISHKKKKIAELETQESKLQHTVDDLMTRTARMQWTYEEMKKKTYLVDYSRYNAMEQFIEQENLSARFERFYEKIFESEYDY